MIQYRQKYNQYVIAHQDELTPGSSYIVIPSLDQEPVVYSSLVQAYPLIWGRDDVFHEEYRGLNPGYRYLKKKV